MNSNAQVHYLKAVRLVEESSHALAIAEFQKALQHEKTVAAIYSDAYCLHKLGRLDEAILEKHKALELCLNDDFPQNRPGLEAIQQDLVRMIKAKDIEVMGISNSLDPFMETYEYYINIVKERIESYKGYFPMTWRFCPPIREEFFKPAYISLEPFHTSTGNETLLIKMEISTRVMAKWAHVYEVNSKLADLSLDAFLETQYTTAEGQAILNNPKFQPQGHLITQDKMVRRQGLPKMDTQWFASLVWFVSVYSNPMYIVKFDNKKWIEEQIAKASRSVTEIDPSEVKRIKKEALKFEKKFKKGLAKKGFHSPWGFITS